MKGIHPRTKLIRLRQTHAMLKNRIERTELRVEAMKNQSSALKATIKEFEGMTDEQMESITEQEFQLMLEEMKEND